MVTDKGSYLYLNIVQTYMLGIFSRDVTDIVSWLTKVQTEVLFSPWPYELQFFFTDHIILCNTEIIELLEISI